MEQELLFRVLIKEGTHLSKSHSVPNAFSGALLNDVTNTPDGLVALIPETRLSSESLRLAQMNAYLEVAISAIFLVKASIELTKSVNKEIIPFVKTKLAPTVQKKIRKMKTHFETRKKKGHFRKKTEKAEPLWSEKRENNLKKCEKSEYSFVLTVEQYNQLASRINKSISQVLIDYNILANSVITNKCDAWNQKGMNNGSVQEEMLLQPIKPHFLSMIPESRFEWKDNSLLC